MEGADPEILGHALAEQAVLTLRAELTAQADARRAAEQGALVQFGLGLNADMPERFADICGPGGIDCPARAAAVWQRVQDAGEQAYDRSAACEFTSLIAYEWSGTRKLANLHRNVIFRTRDVPAAPISHFEAPTAFELWTRLQSECREGLPGCDVLAMDRQCGVEGFRVALPFLWRARLRHGASIARVVLCVQVAQ